MRWFALWVSFALLGCRSGPTGTPADAARESAEACIDRWLSARGLNAYGDPEGTMYAGGTPLFDEATGRTTDRLAHVRRKRPAVNTDCPAK